MSNSDVSRHLWFRDRLEALAAGILDPDEERRISEHLASCPECREAAPGASIGEPGAGRGEHVSASVLVRWPRIAASMSALERGLVEHHLARCEACREDLRLAAAAMTAHGPGGPEERKRPWLRIRREIWLGGWAIGATAAAAALAITWRISALERPAVGPASTPPVALEIQVARAGAHLRDVTRGSGAPAATTLDLAAREPVVLSFEPLNVPDDAQVGLEVARAGGGVVAAVGRRQRELYPDRRIILGSESSPLPEGEYVLRLIARPGAASADTQSYAFVVHRRR
jgi:hypothetical protein